MLQILFEILFLVTFYTARVVEHITGWIVIKRGLTEKVLKKGSLFWKRFENKSIQVKSVKEINWLLPASYSLWASILPVNS
jgi:hypothetical protein